MAFSPEAGLKISITVVVGVGIVDDDVATLALVESDEADDPLHAVRNKRTTGTNRFIMVFSSLGVLSDSANAYGAQEGNRTPDLGDIRSTRSQLDTLTVFDADVPVFDALFGVTVIFHVPLAALENWHFI